jgi:cation diffusion facilitator family transporter
MKSEDNKIRYKLMRNTTILGMVVNIILSICQISIGLLFFSQALVADGIHTLGDLIGDLGVLFASYHSNKAPDEQHPFGHGKIESLATFFLGTILIVVAVGLIYRALITVYVELPDTITIFVAFFVVVAKEGLYRIVLFYGKKISSDMLIANAWHYRTDALSSIIVLVGIAVAIAGFSYADIIAASIVALFIAFMGFKMIKSGINEMIDSSLGPEQTKKIINLILQTPGVISSHMLRTRKSGGFSFADVHVQVPPYISVSEGHKISCDVEKVIKDNLPHLHDIVVHIDVEDDEKNVTTITYPTKENILKEIKKTIPKKIKILNYSLHYLANKIDLQLVFKNDDNIKKENINDIKQKCQKISFVRKVQICLSDDKLT